MKFLLTAVNAKYIHSCPAIYSLRGYAGEAYEEHIELAEYTINNRMEQILADIYKRKPDVIGFSCYIWNWSMIQEIIPELHKLLPEVPIWLGGPEVSFECQSILERYPQITGIMIGEGEQTFVELLQYYLGKDVSVEQNTSIEQKLLEKDTGCEVHQETEKDPRILGTVTRSGHHGFRDIMDINRIPFYYEKLSEEEEKAYENRIIYYESSRGCPFNCSYCLSSIDKKLRIRDTEQVKKELQFFLDRNVSQVKFIDRTFNCNHNHAQEVWKYLLEHDNGVTNFHFEISADLLNEDELQILSQMRPGLIQLEIGVQTTNADTLKAIHRTAKLEPLKKVVAQIHSFHNIHQHLDLIAGLPYEDIQSFRRSFNEVYEMRPQQLQLGFLKVLKGSEMHDRAEEYGIVYQSNPVYEVLYTKWLSYGDVLVLKKIEEVVELFYNSNQFTHTLPVLERLFDSPYDLFLSLADFYEEQGYFVNAPARVYRYQVLLAFGKSIKPEWSALFAELLTFDIYLRENAKSRPLFSQDLSSFKERITEIYRQEEQAPRLLTDYIAQGYDRKQMIRMTHMEVFHYPVWDQQWLLGDWKGDPADEKGEFFVLFDYQKRNPLTYEALASLVGENASAPASQIGEDASASASQIGEDASAPASQIGEDASAPASQKEQESSTSAGRSGGRND